MQFNKLNEVLRTLHLPVRSFYAGFSSVDLAVKTQSSRGTPEKLNYDETSYYFENGLRKVYPYHFTFITYTKPRWIGQKILDIYAKEFRARPILEYERCLRDGTFTVNHGRVDVDYRLKNNDLLINTLHRHELPVTDAPVRVLYSDDDIVAVDKPSSIPVHPCGRFRHNSVAFILAKEQGMTDLKPAHRIDRYTSGLVLFGRTVDRTRLIFNQLRGRQVEKEYVCRVQGHFPRGTIECDQPIGVVCRRIGLCKVCPAGKPSCTEFQVLSRSRDSSVVLCRPRTGRTHQIRVHLQYLGYPIVNDPLYNSTAFGANKGKGGVTEVTEEELLAALEEDRIISEEHGDQRQAGHKGIVSSPAASIYPQDTNTQICLDHSFKPHLMTVDENCHECKVRYRDPKPKDLVMFLHALKYRGPGWQFETKMPDWAAPDWTDVEDNTSD